MADMFKVRLPVKKVCKLFTMSYEVLTRDYSVRFWRSKCPGIQSFQHFNLLKFCTRNYAPLESSDLHAPGTLGFIGFSCPCILPTMLCFFVLISSATFILKKKIILPLIWTELGEKTPPLRRSTRLNTVIKMNQAYMVLQSLQWHFSYASRFRFVLGERITQLAKLRITSLVYLCHGQRNIFGLTWSL